MLSVMESFMKRFLTIFLTIGWIASMSANANENCPKVLMKTNQGDMTIELFCEKAPETTANFLAYVKSGFYDGTIFHRVIPGFMIQGGGFEPGLVQKQTNAPIKNEADNGLKNLTGTLSMARTNDPHSATTQFFLNVNDNDFLNFSSPTSQGWGYAVFARIIDGESADKSLDIAMKIVGTPTGSSKGHQDVPLTDMVIESMTIIE